MERSSPLDSSRLVVAALAAGSALLVGLAVSAPLLEAGRWGIASRIYSLLGYFCHQRPSRSWFLLGSNLGLCARTFSIYAALAAGGAALLASDRLQAWVRGRRRLWGVLLIAPLAVDGTMQLTGVWASTNVLRAVTGILGGLGVLRLGLFPAHPLAAGSFRRTLGCAVAVGLVIQAPATAGAQAASQEVVLKAGTPVFLVIPDGLGSGGGVSAGHPVSMRVVREVKAGDVTVIAAGASASGVVTEAIQAGSWGKKGALGVRIDHVESVDGQLVPLSGSQSAEGRSRESTAAVTAIVTGVICLPLALTGFLFKGEEGAIPPGSEIKAFTGADVTVNVRKAAAD